MEVAVAGGPLCDGGRNESRESCFQSTEAYQRDTRDASHPQAASHGSIVSSRVAPSLPSPRRPIRRCLSLVQKHTSTRGTDGCRRSGSHRFDRTPTPLGKLQLAACVHDTPTHTHTDTNTEGERRLRVYAKSRCRRLTSPDERRATGSRVLTRALISLPLMQDSDCYNSGVDSVIPFLSPSD